MISNLDLANPQSELCLFVFVCLSVLFVFVFQLYRSSSLYIPAQSHLKMVFTAFGLWYVKWKSKNPITLLNYVFLICIQLQDLKQLRLLQLTSVSLLTCISDPQSKNAVSAYRSHAEYFLLSWEIPEVISRQSILFHN